MLARQFRLPATVSFQHAKAFHTAFFSVRIVPNTLSNNRYGFIVSKKLDKRAVVRNRIKRRVRSVIEKEGLGLTGKDVLVVLKPAAIGASFEEISQAVRSILEKLS